MRLAGSMSEQYTARRGEQEQQFNLESYAKKTFALYTCIEKTWSSAMAEPSAVQLSPVNPSVVTNVVDNSDLKGSQHPARVSVTKGSHRCVAAAVAGQR